MITDNVSVLKPDPDLVYKLERTANHVRRKIIRSIHQARSGHTGGRSRLRTW